MTLEVTEVWEKNWDAMHKRCTTCPPTHIDPHCKHCFGSGLQYKYIINRGSSRSSKTYSLIDCLDLAAKKRKANRFTVWRDTKKDANDTVWADFLKRLKATKRYLGGHNVYNKTEKKLTYRSGTTIEVCGADDEEKVHGMTQDIAWLNEPYKITEATFLQIDIRANQVLIDWNPKKSHWVEDVAKRANAIVIDSNFKQNPFCPPAQKATLLGHQPVSMAKVVLDGLIPAHEALIYNTTENKKGFVGEDLEELVRCQLNEKQKTANKFMWQVYGLGIKAEKPNRVFFWKEISLAEYHALPVKEIFASDWGQVDPWAIISAKYYDGALYIHEYNYMSENELKAIMLPTERAQITGGEEGIVPYMFRKLAIPTNAYIICDSARPLKIRALRMAGYDYAVATSKMKIEDGVSMMEDMDIYYTSTSENIIREQENYSRKKDRLGVILDEYEDDFNHTIDDVRYIVVFLFQQGILKKKTKNSQNP